MKRITIIICITLFAISEMSAIGIDSKSMANQTNLERLSYINNIKTIPIGLNVEAHIKNNKSIKADDTYLQRIQRLSILFAINFTVWNKHKISDEFDIGDRISSFVPLLLMAQMPLSKFGVDSDSDFLRNFLVGIWLGYYMDGRKTDFDDYKNKYSTFMIGVLATLYLNEYLSITNSAFLVYVTLKMGVLLQKDKWGYNGFDNNSGGSESFTKFGVFPAIGAEYFVANTLAVFATLGYSPFGWMELGVRLNLGD